MPTPSTTRKPPSRITIPDQIKEFKDLDKIVDFSSVDESLCSNGYKLQADITKAVFYKIEQSKTFDIPTVTEVIAVDNDLHVKLFLSGSPLPHWFSKGKDCRLTKKSYLKNFPPFLRSFANQKPNKAMNELLKIQFKKLDDKPKFSSELFQLALMLRYTSLSAYRLLLDHFPLPSVSLLKKLSQGGVELLKAIKIMLREGKIDKDVVLLIDEMYLQKEIFHEIGFHVRAVVSDNHPSNVAALNDLLSKFRYALHENTILHTSMTDRISYLFFDSVHFLKNIRNNLLNSRQFIFPEFQFPQFIRIPAGEIL